MDNLPKHIAIIPDGNRRWAKMKGLKPWQGYSYGTKTFEKIFKEIIKLEIPYTTFWIASMDNLTKRPKTEIKFLLNVFAKHFPKLAKEDFIHRNEVKINAIGRWREMLPKKIVEAVEMPIKATKNYKKHTLTFLMAYNGDDELVSGIKKIIRESKNKKIQINWQNLKNFLWTKNLPPVDLLIRTSGEPHLSASFLSWHLGYAQLSFPKVYFPDLSKDDFLKIIENYKKRERRFGK